MNPEALPYRPCVGVMLVNHAGRIWAGQRVDAPKDAPPAWQMPQGGIDPGETPRAAALRELTEETSVPASAVTVLAETDDWLRYDLPPDLLGRIWKGRYRGQEQKWFLMRLEGADDLVRIDTDHAEFSAWDWLDFPTIRAAIVPFKRDVYDQVWAAFGAEVTGAAS